MELDTCDGELDTTDQKNRPFLFKRMTDQNLAAFNTYMHMTEVNEF